MEKPVVSVIMGVYNCKSFELLQKSVESIITQTFENWEFIICNDGSTDDTLINLQIIEEMDSRIHLLTYEINVGLNHALNTCIEAATGKYLARQDDDDISDRTRLEKQIAFMESHPEYDIVGANAIIFDDKGAWGHYVVAENPEKKDFLWNSPFIHPVTMMKKQSVEKAGRYWVAKETRRCEDYDLFMRMYSFGMKGYNIQEELYQYRMINDSNKKYRPMKYRVDEAKVRLYGYKNMGILIKGIPYVLKPILIGLIPTRLFSKIRAKQYL